MRINDKKQLPWIMVTVGSLVIAGIAYWVYCATSANGPRGSSCMGLTFGIAGYGLMVYAGLLGLRKHRWFVLLRIGRAQTWMRGHLWLGFLSLPLILFHSGFAFRGTLTRILMTLFFIVIGSGILGAALQQFLPKLMLERLPDESIYEQIPRVRKFLLADADRIATAVCGPLPGIAPVVIDRDRDGVPVETAVAVAAAVEVDDADKVRFRDAYLKTIRPFVEHSDAPDARLGHEHRARSAFETLHNTLPVAVHPSLKGLEQICDELRQLNRQRRMYHWLHGWQLAHVPLSIALLVMGAFHAWMAWRF